MAGLGFPRDLVIEAYLGGWVDVTTQVRQSSPVSITRGRGSEQAKVAPSKLSMVLDNDSGNWNPQDPMGAYYGLVGRNTPFRLGIRVAEDAYARTVSNGLGADYGLEGAASAFAVNGSAATHQVAAANSSVSCWLSGFTLFNAYLKIDYTPSFTDVTGGAIEPANITFRRLDADNYYMMRVTVTTAEAYQLQVIRRFGGIEDTLTFSTITVDGLTHTSGQKVWVAAMIEGRTIFGKVWLASDPEPYDWQVIASDEDDVNALMQPGFVGYRSGVAAGNTNIPVTFTYDNLDVRDMRIAGELSEIAQDWDESHANKRTPVKVEGPLRRLNQGDVPVKSTLRRAYETEVDNPVVAYWHCEDGPGATELASAIEGAPPMVLVGTPDLASFTKFDCSAPIPTVQLSRWFGHVPEYAATGAIQVRFLMYIPPSGTVNEAIVHQLYTTGTAVRWEIWYHTDGGLSLQAYDAADANILSTVIIAFGLNGQLLRVSLELDQDGSDIDWRLAIYEVFATGTESFSGTLAGRTVGRATDVNFAVGSVMTDVAIGHVVVQQATDGLSEQRNENNAWVGELAGNRFERLCRENNIPSGVFGNVLTTAPMGPQKVKKLMDLLLECAVAEQGILLEFRSTFGLLFRTRHSLYAQLARMTLDYAGGQVAAPFKPAEDDRGTINAVTAKQMDGSEYTAVQETGPLNVNNPWDDPDGVGRYEATVTVNVHNASQLPDVATFVRRLGTVTDPRFPSVSTNLRAPDVAAITAQVLAADIGDRALIQNLGAIGLYEDVDQMVQGYTETFGDSTQHTIKFNMTPYAGYRILVLDDELGRLDHEDSELNEVVVIGETSIEVFNSTPTRWITTASHPSHFPFDIIIGGEVMPVSAITGTGSVQTFTVTRTLAKQHEIGDRVHVAHPVYLGR